MRPTVTPYDLQLVAEKLSGHVVQMKQPEAISSTAVKISWEVSAVVSFLQFLPCMMVCNIWCQKWDIAGYVRILTEICNSDIPLNYGTLHHISCLSWLSITGSGC